MLHERGGVAAMPAILRALPLTDLGSAERFVFDHRDEIRYVSPDHGWHVWDGRRWRVDRDLEVVRRMKTTIRAFHRVALELDDGDVRRQQIAFALKWENIARIRAALDLARSEARVIAPLETLDHDPMKFNVENGTIELEFGEVNPHRREDLITKIAPVVFDWGAPAPRWFEFLDQVFGGDKSLIDYLQRAVGYSLTGRTSEQALFLLWGRGANGKSTLIETLRTLFGDYGQQAPIGMFMAGRKDGARPELARLPGARFLAAVETGEGHRLDETLVKTLTGGDTIATRPLYRDVFEFRPAFKAWIATNHKPEIQGVDDAIWRRIHLIPFTRTFELHERNPRLAEQLRGELSGILTWAIQGCQAWLEHGLEPPNTVVAATSEYRHEMDTLGQFLDERCENNRNAATKARALYTAYTTWAANAGEHVPLSEKAFSTRLTERGYSKTRHSDGMYWQQVAIKPERSVQGAGS